MVNVTIILYEFNELSKNARDFAITEHGEFLHEVEEDGEKILTNKTIIDNINDHGYLFWANGELAPVSNYHGTINKKEVIIKKVLYLQGDTYLIGEDKTDQAS